MLIVIRGKQGASGDSERQWRGKATCNVARRKSMPTWAKADMIRSLSPIVRLSAWPLVALPGSSTFGDRCPLSAEADEPGDDASRADEVTESPPPFATN